VRLKIFCFLILVFVCDRFKYDIVGHSGEESSIPFTVPGKPPSNEKERLHVLKEMHAHAQYCMSGNIPSLYPEIHQPMRRSGYTCSRRCMRMRSTAYQVGMWGGVDLHAS
jgi:hypothetical protein